MIPDVKPTVTPGKNETKPTATPTPVVKPGTLQKSHRFMSERKLQSKLPKLM